jgi:hypothetical protein
MNFETVFENLGKNINVTSIRQLMWSDVCTPLGATNRNYEEIRDMTKLQNAVE